MGTTVRDGRSLVSASDNDRPTRLTHLGAPRMILDACFYVSFYRNIGEKALTLPLPFRFWNSWRLAVECAKEVNRSLTAHVAEWDIV